MQLYEEILNNPNLPDNRVTGVIAGAAYRNTLNSLNNLGIRIINIHYNKLLPGSLTYHSDMNIFHYSNNEFYISKETAGESGGDFLLNTIPESTGSSYPEDCRLNAVRIGNKLICNKKSASVSILNRAESDGLEIINVKQGYTKCSVCVIDENSFITDDESIYKSAGKYFDDVLFVSKGSIRLEGMNYGFIGGCTGKINKNEIAFNGRIESHTDHNSIIDFLDKHKISAREMTDDTLTDIGSILPVFQIKGQYPAS